MIFCHGFGPHYAAPYLFDVEAASRLLGRGYAAIASEQCGRGALWAPVFGSAEHSPNKTAPTISLNLPLRRSLLASAALEDFDIDVDE